MTDSKDINALESISCAVDESQLKIILTTQCIKAQSLLVTKLRKQSEHQKEVCSFINNANLKLQTEIRIAEQKIKSSITALETIKSANVELQKDLLLSRERKSDIVERVNNGITKYEGMWQEAKTKYEKIPFIKRYLETKNKTITIKQNIDNLANDSQKLIYLINEKKKQIAGQDRKRVIELADYLINERPKTLLLIQEKYEKMKELDKIIKKHSSEGLVNDTSKASDKSVTNEDSNKNDDEAGMVLPKLELCHIDLDLLSDKLNKIKKSDSFNLRMKVTNSNESLSNIETERSIINNDYNMILINDNNLNAPKNYSQKKLIHIIDDINLNENESKEILAKVKTSYLRDMDVTEVISTRNGENQLNAEQVGEKMDVVEEINLISNQTSVIGPPSQFLDITEGTHNEEIIDEPSQTSIKKLDLSNNQYNTDVEDIEITKSGESDRSYEKIKDTILKKHKLDLSPQFVYSKKSMVHNTTKSEVKSKFFDDNKETREVEGKDYNNTPQILEIEDSGKEKPNNTDRQSQKLIEENTVQKNDVPISGFLFNHRVDGIVQLSNTSLDTTGYGDGDNDFPHCIDSSLLLSPKADFEAQDNEGNNVQVLSQEVPNFLSGLRKGGFSFFSPSTPDEASTSENSTKTQRNSFNFNFGGEEKKSRGGLFSMFR